MNELGEIAPPKTVFWLTSFLKNERFWDILAIVLLAVLGWFYWQMVDNVQLGFTHDDGVYAIAGKSLSLGKGYRLLHVVGQPAQVKYPFLFPSLLSFIWLLNPNFPDNLVWMNILCVGMAVLGAGLIYAFLTRCFRLPGWLGILITAFVFCNYFCLYFSTLIMSEAPYLFFSFLTLIYLQRQTLRPGKWPLQSVLIAAILSILTFYIRVPAISLMAATGFWLLFHRQFKNAFIYGGLGFLGGIIPWFAWTKTQTPLISDLNYPLVNAYSNYGLEFFNNYLGTGNYFNGVGHALRTLIGNSLGNLTPLIGDFKLIYPDLKNEFVWVDLLAWVSTYLMIGFFLLQIIHTIRLALTNKRWNPDAFSIPALYVLFYLFLITFWNYEDQMSRFLVVVTPLIWLYLFKPILPERLFRSPTPAFVAQQHNTLAHTLDTDPVSDARRLEDPERHPRWKALFLTLLILYVSITALWPTRGSFNMLTRARQHQWVESGPSRNYLWGEYTDSFAWIKRSISPEEPLGVCADVVYYLYTGHPTYYVFWASLKKRKGRFTPDAIRILMDDLDRRGVHYLVSEPHMQSRTVTDKNNKVMKQLWTIYPKRFEKLYTTPRKSISIYKILPRTANNMIPQQPFPPPSPKRQ